MGGVRRAVGRLVLGVLGVQLMLCGYLLGQYLLQTLEPPRVGRPVDAGVDADTLRAVRQSLQQRQQQQQQQQAQQPQAQQQLQPRQQRSLPAERDVQLTRAPNPLLQHGQQDGRAGAAQPVASKYLQLEWHLHLGFNNVRYQLELGFMLADLLRRRLVLPPRLRMRRCLRESACQVTRCSRIEDDDYWCPLDMFFDPRALNRAGGVILDDEEVEAMAAQPSATIIKRAFERIYDPTALWLDKIPYRVRHELGAQHIYPKVDPPTPLVYYTHALGCELTYNSVVRQDWTFDVQRQTVYGFVDAFESEPSNVG